MDTPRVLFHFFEVLTLKFIEISLKIISTVKTYEAWGIREKNRKTSFLTMKF